MTGTVLFNDTATTDIYSLSLHDALPISSLQFHATVLLAEPDASAENQQRGEEHPQWERLEHHPVDHDGNRGHQGEIHFRWSSVERHVPLPFRRLVNRRRVRGKTHTRD